MATIRKRGNRWQAEVRIKGVKRTKTWASKAAAQDWALKEEQQIRASNSLEGHDRTVIDAVRRYAKEISPRRKSNKWEQLRAKVWEALPFASTRLAELTSSDISEWRDGRLKEVKPSTVAREMTFLRTVLNQARQEWGWMTHAPASDVKKPEQPAHRDRVISDTEIKDILWGLGYVEGTRPKTKMQQTAVAFLLALETGMRAGELTGLSWDRVDLERRVAHLPKTKNGKKRDVPLSKKAVELFKLLEKGGPVFDFQSGQLSVQFMRGRKRAGLADVTFHDSRHTAVTRLARKLELLDLARMIGHTNPRSLMVYYNPSAEELAKRLD